MTRDKDLDGLEAKLMNLEEKMAKKLAAVAGTIFVGQKDIIQTKLSKWLEKKPLKDS